MAQDSDAKRYHDQHWEILDKLSAIKVQIIARLRESLTSGRLAAEGYPPNGPKRRVEAELWPALPRFDWTSSSAFHPKTGLRFDALRIHSGEPARVDKAIRREAETLSKTLRAAVIYILEIWGPGGIPKHLRAKEWLAEIERKAREANQHTPSQRTIQDANVWIRTVRDTL
jgi:hypothetical protein